MLAALNAVAVAASSHDGFLPIDREAVGEEVGALRAWLGDHWFAELWRSEARTQLSDWVLPGVSGDQPMRTFRAFAASALSSRHEEGIDRALSTLNGRSGGWHHLLDQLELASLAKLAGASIEFEPDIGRKRSDDLLIVPDTGPGPFTVDVSNRSQSRTDRVVGGFADQIVPAAVRSGVASTHHLRLLAYGDPPDYDLQPLLTEIARPISPREGRQVESISGTVRLVFEPLTPAATPGISIEDHSSNREDLHRAHERVAEKARKRDQGSTTWVHLSFFDKLCFATDFATRPLPAQARLLRAALTDELADGRLRGVVLAIRTRLRAPDCLETIDERTIALRANDDYVTRVVLIAGANHVDPQEVTWWSDLYTRHSPHWLDATRQSLKHPPTG